MTFQLLFIEAFCCCLEIFFSCRISWEVYFMYFLCLSVFSVILRTFPQSTSAPQTSPAHFHLLAVIISLTCCTFLLQPSILELLSVELCAAILRFLRAIFISCVSAATTAFCFLSFNWLFKL